VKPIFIAFFLLAGLQKAGAQTDTAAAHKYRDSLMKSTINSSPFKVEIESEFPGGARGWLAYLNSHLVYPKKAVRKRIQGTVLLQFIVDKDGTVSDLKVLDGDPILAEAALKAMEDTPKWMPAVQNGKRVKSYKKQPIVFKLEAQ
jgi:periplasmic protein TonB